VSTHWDIKCFDCGVEAGFHINHGERQLTEIIKVLPCVPAAKVAIEAIDDIACPQLHWSSSCEECECCGTNTKCQKLHEHDGPCERIESE
jgi:hypothetical protein